MTAPNATQNIIPVVKLVANASLMVDRSPQTQAISAAVQTRYFISVAET